MGNFCIMFLLEHQMLKRGDNTGGNEKDDEWMDNKEGRRKRERTWKKRITIWRILNIHYFGARRWTK